MGSEATFTYYGNYPPKRGQTLKDSRGIIWYVMGASRSKYAGCVLHGPDWDSNKEYIISIRSDWEPSGFVRVLTSSEITSLREEVFNYLKLLKVDFDVIIVVGNSGEYPEHYIKVIGCKNPPCINDFKGIKIIWEGRMCPNCDSKELSFVEADSFYDYDSREGDDYYAYFKCNNCSRESFGWDLDDCKSTFFDSRIRDNSLYEGKKKCPKMILKSTT